MSAAEVIELNQQVDRTYIYDYFLEYLEVFIHNIL